MIHPRRDMQDWFQGVNGWGHSHLSMSASLGRCCSAANTSTRLLLRRACTVLQQGGREGTHVALGGLMCLAQAANLLSIARAWSCWPTLYGA